MIAMLGETMQLTDPSRSGRPPDGQRRRAAHARDLTALLRERPDLSGVYAPADFAADALRWCV
jgi:hypothetical protein